MIGKAVGFRTRVNGQLLAQNIGKEVSIMGTVISSKSDGSSFELRASDNFVVTIVMRSPLSEPVEGVVEVQGVPQTKSSVLCNYYINFPEELSATYDADTANDTVMLLSTLTNPWKA